MKNLQANRKLVEKIILKESLVIITLVISKSLSTNIYVLPLKQSITLNK